MSKNTVLLFILLLIVNSVYSLNIYSPYSEITNNEEFYFNVICNDYNNVLKLEYTINFDSTLIEFIDNDDSINGLQMEMLYKDAISENTLISPGVLNSVISFVSKVNSPINVIKYRFKVLSGALSDVLISINNVKVNNASNSDNPTITYKYSSDNIVLEPGTDSSIIRASDGLLLEFNENTSRSGVFIKTKLTTLAQEGISSFTPSADSNTVPLNKYYKIELNGTLNERNINLYIPFNLSEVPAGFTWNQMKIYYFNENIMKWERYGGKALKDSKGNYYVKLAVEHFSIYTIMADKFVYSSNNITNMKASPNPFSPNNNGKNDITSISFVLKNDSEVTIKLFDRTGFELKTLLFGQNLGAGNNSIDWDGKDKYGNTLRTGLYSYYINALDKNGKADKKTGTVIISRNLNE
ncbi:MAG: gliding motility-associated C-terminal domain-containing protein [Candidatus Muirbacterium halophilum]|nr:gliding motility-associated C-terminal domain-containing protein [Candidatus Muirbacterium halophilum]